ncbi:hypothetical protein [Vibrio aestuarianus]|uniref:hypothetical protein n=1 Tax=Vibrio aestuarianus TaxID=28171 RepID=UPI002382AC53|nr:hypothetical protein [Vibrio aestuarianus]MDE1291844.1 esterase FrsA [Vibrio aestuarianus]
MAKASTNEESSYGWIFFGLDNVEMEDVGDRNITSSEKEKTQQSWVSNNGAEGET